MTTDPDLLDDGPRPAIRLTRRYDHPVARVWQAVTTSEHLSAWFPSPVEIDLRPGGEIRFGAFEGPAGRGRVLTVDAPHHLAFSWGGDRLRFDLEPDGDGTRLTLVHELDDRPGAASVATGWEACLRGLVDALAGSAPAAPGRMAGRHEELVTRFGLDRPVITRDGAGWTARFERQLVCPTAAAWDLFLAGATAPAVGEPFRPAGAPSVVLGTVTEADPASSFAFDVAPGEPGDAVQLSLTDGTGHGARLVLTVSGSVPAELDAAVEQWGGGAIARVARGALRLAATPA
jgi:uncharacterized protein YndB with AHSA1/START domain